MTLHLLAIISLIVVGLAYVMPGSAFVRKPVVDWGTPNVYFLMIKEVLLYAVLIWLIFFG